MAFDPYAPCPCGSGEKFKWCCQKVESYAERSQRMYENGQIDAALEVLEEGLRKEPNNPWLSSRKALILLTQGKAKEAKELLSRVLAKHPNHLGAHSMMVQAVNRLEGAAAAAAQFQQTMTACPPEHRRNLYFLARLVAGELSEDSEFPAALKHLALAQKLSPGEAGDGPLQSLAIMIESNDSVSPWLKNPYTLSPAPEPLRPEQREGFSQALRWANEGLWASAAAAFETLAGSGGGPPAERNAGLCRLWMADDEAAAAALRRYCAKAGATIEAVDLEALCQHIAPVDKSEVVERVQLIWPLRNRDGLLETLRGTPEIDEEGHGPIDPSDEDSPEVTTFVLIDRPKLVVKEGQRPSLADLPRVVARIHVGQEIVALEAFDDERLGALSDRFTALAGQSIPPAHPRTKVIGETSRSSLPFTWEWSLPEEFDPEDFNRLYREQVQRAVLDDWPQAPQSFLGGRTPLQAMNDPARRQALRAAVFRMEVSAERRLNQDTFVQLRQKLNLEPEPEIDPATADISAVHLARLHLVPADRLDDAALVLLYRRARRFALRLAIHRAAQALADRPALMEHEVSVIDVITSLVTEAVGSRNREEAEGWLRKGKELEPEAQRAGNAPAWDMLDLRIRTIFEAPEAWVPDLVVLLDRYGNDAAANEIVVRNLVALGLVELVPNPENPKQLWLDTRPLQLLVERFGPRVTTASGALGVSATKGIWTPGSESPGGGGGLWTPGSESGAAPGEGKSKLIIPGR